MANMSRSTPLSLLLAALVENILDLSLGRGYEADITQTRESWKHLFPQDMQSLAQLTAPVEDVRDFALGNGHGVVVTQTHESRERLFP